MIPITNYVQEFGLGHFYSAEVFGLSKIDYIFFLVGTGSDKVRQKDPNIRENRFQPFNCKVFIYFLTP